jgi:maleamate amidohydrolase
VVRDCVGDRAAGPHEANLFDLQQKYADVISLDATLKHLEARGRQDSRTKNSAQAS